MGTDDCQSQNALPGEEPMLLSEDGEDEDASAKGIEAETGDEAAGGDHHDIIIGLACVHLGVLAEISVKKH